MEREPILSVRDLDVKFNLRGRKLHAIRGVSLDLYKGESLAIVGESGSGKSVFVKTFMGLLDANGWIDGGSIMYNGEDLTQFKTEKQWLKVRGKEIAMVLQDPMTSLNPLNSTLIRTLPRSHRVSAPRSGILCRSPTSLYLICRRLSRALSVFPSLKICLRKATTRWTETSLRQNPSQQWLTLSLKKLSDCRS